VAILASLVVKILGDTAGLEEAVGKTDGLMGKIGKVADSKLGKTVSLAAKIGAGAVIAEFGLATTTAANFEHAIDQVGAVANATETEMKSLADTALRIGRDTAFSATQAAAAMENLAANGISVEDIINGAADAAVALAAAGGTDLAKAADVASTAMAVWGLRASDMTEVANRLAGAANVSRFGVEDMALAIAQGGGAAASAGVDFGDFTTAIAAIAPYFNSGSDAGTSFKQFLNGLTPNSKAAIEALTELGLITKEGGNAFFDASGKLKSMAEISGLLNAATADLSEQQKAQALETIFGSDAMRAAAAISKVTAEQFAAMSAQMRDTSAAEVAAQRMGNFKGTMEELNGSLETLQIRIGTALLPVLNRLARFGVEELVPAGEKIFDFLDRNRPVAYALAIALGVLVAATLPIPTAIALVITAGAMLINHWDVVQSKALELKAEVLGVFRSLPEPVQAAIRFMVDDVLARILAMKNAAVGYVELLRTGFTVILALIHGDWDEAWKGIQRLGQTAAQLVVDSVTATLGTLPEKLFDIGLLAGRKLLEGLQKIPGVGEALDLVGGLGGAVSKIGGKLNPFDSHSAGIPFVRDTGLAYLHRGERVLTSEQNRQYSTVGGGGMGSVINVYVNVEGSIRSDQELAGVIRDQALRGAFRGVLAGA
jgi:TP901 family phage tail tape measure protein